MSETATMIAHTPGPWRWFHYPDGRKLLASQSRAVLHCPDAPMACDPADATLIAAGPELLAALTAIFTSTREDEHGEQHTIRRYLTERGVFHDDIQGSRRLVAEACRYAIAKAEGQ